MIFPSSGSGPRRRVEHSVRDGPFLQDEFLTRWGKDEVMTNAGGTPIKNTKKLIETVIPLEAVNAASASYSDRKSVV